MKKVLIVDDEDHVRRLVAVTLDGGDYQVLQAKDGDQAMEVVRRERPTLVLLDVQMPGLDGFVVCETLRREHDAVDLPIVMMTGREDTLAMDRAYAAGATDIVTKPVPWKVLGQRVRQPIGPVSQLFVRAAATVADQRDVVAKPLLDHAVGQLDCRVDVLGILIPVEQHLGPRFKRR